MSEHRLNLSWSEYVNMTPAECHRVVVARRGIGRWVAEVEVIHYSSDYVRWEVGVIRSRTTPEIEPYWHGPWISGKRCRFKGPTRVAAIARATRCMNEAVAWHESNRLEDETREVVATANPSDEAEAVAGAESHQNQITEITPSKGEGR